MKNKTAFSNDRTGKDEARFEPQQGGARCVLEQGSLDMTKEIVRSAGWESLVPGFQSGIEAGKEELMPSVMIQCLRSSRTHGQRRSVAFHAGDQKNTSRVTRLARRTLEVFAILLAWASFGQTRSNAQTFALNDTKDLVLLNVKAEATEYKGRKAVRLTKDTEKDGFALLRGTDFQDGTIEGDIALRITTPPAVRMPGFVGIAFRARPDASRYELFYLRPRNSRSDDQAMRNHSVQYASEPDFGWYKLRREWPWVYEAHAELQPETWTKVTIEVKGRSANLYLNGSEQPSLVVEGLKGEDLRGGIALWAYQGEEAYFSNFRITSSVPLPVKNGSDASGTWQVKCSSDRDGSKVTGTWSGDLGNVRPITGTWRNGYVELTFNAEWPIDDKGAVTAAVATLAGWIDSDSAGGRMKVDGRADGRWTATRKP